MIGAAQLEACGITRNTARRWRRRGRLYRIHSDVDAFGHPSVPPEGLMVAALLHVGATAVLSHRTAAWWWGILDERPDLIHVSCLHRAGSSPGLVIHQRRRLEATRHRRFPITTLSQTFIDLAAGEPRPTVRQALANADYRGILKPAAIAAVSGRGRPGTTSLRQALKEHQPRLAQTRSELERRFLALCETAGFPLPEVNGRLAGWTVDALWRAEHVAVELDGRGNHRSPAQIERDRRKELELRAAGFVVLRYTWRQVTDQSELVIADLAAALGGAVAERS